MKSLVNCFRALYIYDMDSITKTIVHQGTLKSEGYGVLAGFTRFKLKPNGLFVGYDIYHPSAKHLSSPLKYNTIEKNVRNDNIAILRKSFIERLCYT